MANIEHLVESVRRLPREEQERFLARLEALGIPHDDELVKRGWDEILALAGSVNRGRVRVPLPSREMIHEDIDP